MLSKETEIGANYIGPQSLTEDLNSAVGTLSERLSVEHSECKTHSVLQVGDYGDQESLRATAVYLVGAIAQSIEANLRIRSALFDEVDQQRELARDVVSVVGQADADERFKTMKRYPWMWEAISHMLVHLSRHASEFHPTGSVLAKTGIKFDVNDHGLDLLAIYEATELGISAGECKAYLENPSRAITDASNRLNEVDANERDMELRAVVSQLRPALVAAAQERVAGAFWRNERCYLPFVCCDETAAPDWTKKRQVLKRLTVPVSHKVLYQLSLENATGTLDRICGLMREYVDQEEWSTDV